MNSIIFKVPDPHKNTVSSFKACELKYQMKVKICSESEKVAEKGPMCRVKVIKSSYRIK